MPSRFTLLFSNAPLSFPFEFEILPDMKVMASKNKTEDYCIKITNSIDLVICGFGLFVFRAYRAK